MDLITILTVIISLSILGIFGYYTVGIFIYNKKTKKLKDEIERNEKLLFDDLKNEYGSEEAEKLLEDLKDKFIKNNSKK